jgi:DNA-binding NarL/FixJ family response regulator
MMAPAGTGAIRVVLCDDVARLRQALRAALEDDGEIEVVGETANGREGLQVITQLRPDVALIDLSMPEMDGMEVIPLIRKSAPNTGIIVLSGFGASRMGKLALERGADRYVEKGERLDVLRATVTEVARERA